MQPCPPSHSSPNLQAATHIHHQLFTPSLSDARSLSPTLLVRLCLPSISRAPHLFTPSQIIPDTRGQEEAHPCRRSTSPWCLLPSQAPSSALVGLWHEDGETFHPPLVSRGFQGIPDRDVGSGQASEDRPPALAQKVQLAALTAGAPEEEVPEAGRQAWQGSDDPLARILDGEGMA